MSTAANNAKTGQLVEMLAELVHEVNRAYCIATGDESQQRWDEAADWQQESARKGVLACLQSELTPEQQHSMWMVEKQRTGWIFGETKDEVAKTHPCMVPYAQLPDSQKVKDYLFGAVVRTIKRQVGA